MVIGLEHFRQAGGGFVEREILLDADRQGVHRSGLSGLVGRIQGWFRSAKEQRERVGGRKEVKRKFLDLLGKTEGEDAAAKALNACGLPAGWAHNDRPLTNHQVGKILDKAQDYRLRVVRHNEALLKKALNDLKGGHESRDLRAAIARAVRNDSRYGNQEMKLRDIETLREQAKAELCELRIRQCEERFPALTGWVQSGLRSSVELNPARLTQDLRRAYCGDPQQESIMKALDLIDETTVLLGWQAWNLNSQGDLSAKLTQCHNELDRMRTSLNSAGPQGEQPSVLRALSLDIDRQIGLLEAKRTYIDEMRQIDPLTDRAVKYSNLIWAEAGLCLLEQLQDDVGQGQPALDRKQQEALGQVCSTWAIKEIDKYKKAYEESVTEPSSPIEAPGKSNKNTHPIVQGKRDMQARLRTRLEEASIPRGTLDKLFSKTSLKHSERQALARLEHWQPVVRDMPVMRDGVMRTYRSEIVPAPFINHQLGKQSGNTGRGGGVPSGVTGSGPHARNLKVSRLRDSRGRVMTTVVGHGVLDMWGIKNKSQRQAANKQGAREVLEVALNSNGRLRDELNKPTRQQNAQAPRLVHVSVNLTSPDTVRDFLGVRNYQELTYTRNQFRAFEANSGLNQSLLVFNPEHPDEKPGVAKVNVDTITFSFGINAMATGGLRNLMRVWDNVHAHNTANMIKLVGDLGEGEFGARGARPGGFVGEVYDRLENVYFNLDDSRGDQAARLMAQLRGQTDLVRRMFTEGAFRKGNGDPAKMGREILVLQSLAEQGLNLVNARDLAGTMSKGCKSDKDRGGVTDVELKSKLILRDLGGEMNPDERLVGDDQGVYYMVSAGSGQLENQRWNTGLPGSKEAGHLKDRLPDAEVRQFLCGLGKFAGS
ncbi:inositol phosphate phosphatase SopB [Castellaniella sp. WN]